MILPRNIANLILALTFLCGTGSLVFAPPAAPSFSQIVVFGDSLSDTGNVRDRTNSKSGGTIVRSLPPGHYTAVLAGINGGVGNGLVEVHYLEPGASSTLANPQHARLRRGR